MSPRQFERPSNEEEVEIQKGIAADPDNPEWTDAMWTDARPAAEVVPDLVSRHRGKQKTPTKESTSIRLDRDVLAALRMRPGWQTDVNAMLRAALGLKTPTP